MRVKKGTISAANMSPETVAAFKAGEKAKAKGKLPKAPEPTVTIASLTRTFNPEVPVKDIYAGANIRKAVITPANDPKLLDLVESIKQQGIQSPLLLLKNDAGGYYIIIAGYRRFAAARLAGQYHVPAYVYDNLTDRQILEIQISENIHRADLTPSEEAAVYERMRVDLDYTIEEIALRVGKSPKHISRYLKLIMLPAEVLSQIDNGDLSLAKAQILCSMPKAVMEKLTGRDAYMLRGGTAKGFEETVHSHYMVDLGGRKFDLKKKYRDDDGTVYPACTECPHKGQLEMFEDFVNDDKCPFDGCFLAKVWIVEEQERRAKKKKRSDNENDGDDDDEDDDEETPEERAEREAREAKWEKEQQERKAKRMAELAICKEKAEWYIRQKFKVGYSAKDYCAVHGDRGLEMWDDDETVFVDELYLRYAGKNIEQLSANGTWGEFYKAMVVREIFRQVEDEEEDELVKWIGCDMHSETTAKKDEDSDEDEGEEDA